MKYIIYYFKSLLKLETIIQEINEQYESEWGKFRNSDRTQKMI